MTKLVLILLFDVQTGQMKNKNYTWLLIFPIVLAASTFSMAFMKSVEEVEQTSGNIKWMTLDEITVAQKTTPKPVIVDLYTSWCVWCKKMDESTFSDPTLISYINKNFYVLKFDAEAQQSVTFKDKVYDVQKINNRNVHQLAWDWGNVNGRIGYPTIVILDNNMDKLQAFPGFKDVDAMTSLAKFYGDGIYKNKSWQDYLSSGK